VKKHLQQRKRHSNEGFQSDKVTKVKVKAKADCIKSQMCKIRQPPKLVGANSNVPE
jgi:hypothetical protein